MAGSAGGSSIDAAASAEIGPTRLRRARDADLAVFAVNGLLLATWMARLPEVKSGMGLTPGRLGLLLLAVSMGSLLGLPLAGRLVQRLGSTRVIRLFGVTASAGIAAAGAAIGLEFGFLPVALVLFALGLGNGVWDVAQNYEGTVVEQGLGRSVMPWFHAAFSGGTLTGALFAMVMIRSGVPLWLHVASVAVAVVVVLFWATARFISDALPRTEGTAAASHEGRTRSPWTEPRTLLIGVMVLAAAFTEGTANDWLAVAFVDGHGVSPAVGVVGLACFLASMTLGRILGTGLLDRYGRLPVLRVLFGSAAIGSALVVFGSTPMAFVGAAIWGVGSSLGFPVGMSAAADDPSRAAVRLSVVATIGYGAFLAGPALVGFIGDHVGALRALTVVGLFAVAALLVVPAATPLESAA